MADDNYKNSSSLHSDDDFISELTHQMSRFMLQEDDDHNSFHFSTNPEPWELTSSPDSTLWSPVSCNQGSSEGSSQEPSPPATPCWKTTTYEERAISKHNIDHGVLYSHKALIQEQIKAIEVKQHYINDIKKQHQQHALSPKQNEEKQEIDKKKGNGRNRVLPRLPRPTPLQIGGGGGGGCMRAVFIGGSGSRNGTGVFLPRGGTVVAPSELTKKKQGKGCSTVLIPARVVQALQLHFDKTAAMSRGPKVVDFPPLRDLVLSNRESMYSVDENQQSTKSPNDVQNDMILPNEWTY
ncbi:bromodomain-containing protein 2-like [Trifolium pratense]|nr:bromodomain-containing protein 2-like [Trifolium pratense]